ncbi:creatine kinase M-type-like [Megalops cyprinoides]|uniref:creatine kinase M-type-like n=1 Tax=Megalops cyprinoides TaxID=118141 RepID=UPI001864E6E6|nr:creatine kinase M-type-like [Megalops cyprinoides]
MPRKRYPEPRMWKIKPPIEYPMEVKYRPILESLVPLDPMSLIRLKRGTPEEEFPSLDRNYTVMGRILTLNMYKRQYNRATDSGVIFSDVIQPGLEDPGQLSGPVSVGCLAGDAQCYILFCDFFDRIIEAYHGYKMTSNQESDFNYDNLKGGDDFDREHVLGCEVRVSRCVEDFSFPVHCCRGERRQLLSLAKKALGQVEEELPGQLHSMEELTEDKLGEALTMETATDLRRRTGVSRDWPDARAVWISKDGNLAVWINIDDHLQLVSARTDSNIKKAFESACVHLQKLEVQYRKLRHSFIWKQHLGWVVSSPAEVGTGLKASVQLKLRHLAQHKRLQNILERLRLCMDFTGSSEVYKVSNAHTIGFTEVELIQLLVDGVKLLIVMDRTLEDPEGSIDHLVPAQK